MVHVAINSNVVDNKYYTPMHGNDTCLLATSTSTYLPSPWIQLATLYQSQNLHNNYYVYM